MSAPHPVGSRRLDLSPPARRGESGVASANLVQLGEFGRAHGLRGEVRLKSFTADPMAIAGYGPLVTVGGRVVKIAAARPAGSQPDLLVVRLEGATTRDAAEALNGAGLWVERERLGQPEDEDEFFLADLVGLAAVSADGEAVGTVTSVQNYGGGDLLEIALGNARRTVLVPFTKLFVPSVEIGVGRVVTAAPALFAPEPESAPPPDETGA